MDAITQKANINGSTWPAGMLKSQCSASSVFYSLFSWSRSIFFLFFCVFEVIFFWFCFFVMIWNQTQPCFSVWIWNLMNLALFLQAADCFSPLFWTSVCDWCGIRVVLLRPTTWHRPVTMISVMPGDSDQCFPLLPGFLQCHKMYQNICNIGMMLNSCCTLQVLVSISSKLYLR